MEKSKVVKLAGLLALLIGVVFSVNKWLFSNWAYSVGVVLGALLVCLVVINLFIRWRAKKKGINGDSFIFPKAVADTMKVLDPSIQYEATMISTSFLIIGMILFSIYFLCFTDYGWTFKGFYLFNALCGIGLMSSNLITAYQQFVSYRDTLKVLDFANSSLNSGELGCVMPGQEIFQKTGESKPLPKEDYPEQAIKEELSSDMVLEDQSQDKVINAYKDYSNQVLLKQMKGGIQK